MFVGDARPHDNDAWLLLIVESVDSILIPAVRMAIKLHDVSHLLLTVDNYTTSTLQLHYLCTPATLPLLSSYTTSQSSCDLDHEILKTFDIYSSPIFSTI